MKVFHGKNSVMARRMRHLRRKLGDTGPRFAARIGLSYHRWHNYESGYPVTLSAALQMVERIPGLTLDYIFRGKTDNLPKVLRDQLTDGSPGQSDE
jgi:transcriptional regulator with XRE-family HTH domain